MIGQNIVTIYYPEFVEASGALRCPEQTTLMSATRFGLPSPAIEKICEVFSRHPHVEKAILYGSRAKGNYKNGSDIDLTLRGDGLGFRDLLAMMNELDELLLPYTIDLSILGMIRHVPLREHIERVGQEFYHRQGAGVALSAARA